MSLRACEPSDTASVTAVTLPRIIHAPSVSSPVDLAALWRREKEGLSVLLRASGALLFRGYNVTEPRDLSAVIQAAGERSMPYVAGDSPRTDLGGGIYTSTEAPPAIRIPLHNELSYLEAFPRRLWMACAHPGDGGGETNLGDGRTILRALDPIVRERFMRRGVRYQCAFRGPGGLFSVLDRAFKASKSWMDAFQTNDPREAEARCRRIATRMRWEGNGSLVFETQRSATIEHPDRGDAVWFNQAHLFLLSPRYLGRLRWAVASALFFDLATRPHHATYGDGQPIEAATLDHIHDVLEAHTMPVRWERGDALWIDNLSCMHGRQPFRGRRRVMLAMTA